jgi:farnesyl-diphosphate farnesyltransferase
MANAADKSLPGLLKEVSRSFYMTLWILPSGVRHQIGLAYLLARTTDTIADTELVPLEQRLQALQELRERLLGSRQTSIELGDLARHQGLPAERVLLEQLETSLTNLDRLSAADLELTRRVLDIITSGQMLDLRRFSGASAGRVTALATAQELEDYTYRVAGCVGEFWTKMCRAHVFPKARLDDEALLRDGVRFGKGLQLVNILRDLPVDLRQGRCYVPENELALHSLKPCDLLHPENETGFRPLYDAWLAQAAGHLLAGWDYTNSLPFRCARVRLACAWPILIGLQTIARLRTGRILEPAHRIKISRDDIKGILWRSLLYYPFPPTWRGLANRSSSGFPVQNKAPL